MNQPEDREHGIKEEVLSAFEGSERPWNYLADYDVKQGGDLQRHNDEPARRPEHGIKDQSRPLCMSKERERKEKNEERAQEEFILA